MTVQYVHRARRADRKEGWTRVAAGPAQAAREAAAWREAGWDTAIHLKAMDGYDRHHAVPYPSYSISNLGGRITDTRQRIERLEAQAARTEKAGSGGGILVERLGRGYARVTFAEKPDREVIQELKDAGYRWAKGSWLGETERLPSRYQEAQP